MDVEQFTHAHMGTITPFPAVKPGYHLASAAIGRSGETPTIVGVFCPDWCTEDHVAAQQVAIEDIVHSSNTASFGVKSFLGGSLVAEFYATIKQDPASHDERLRQAHIVFDNGGDDGFQTVDEAEETVQRLLVLAADIQAKIRTARLHNQAEAKAVAS